MKKKNIVIQLIAITSIVVVANLISNQLYFRLDFTEDQRYTLSEATKNILEDLDDVITVSAYFSEDLPPQLLNNRKDFEDILMEYEQRSGGNVVYEFINPNEDQAKEQEVQKKGIGTIMINLRENDRVEQMRAYMGAMLQMGDRKEIIPLIQPGAAMEYELTTSIKKLSVVDKPKIGILSGHGEIGLSSIPQLVQQMSVLYSVENYQIKEEEIIPNHYQAIAVFSPSDTIPESHFFKLDQYLKNGGRIVVAYSNVQGDLQKGLLSTSPNIGLVDWLAAKGVQLGSDFILDMQCATVSVQQRQGFFTISSQKEFPYFPRISNFGDHPISKGMDEVTFTFANAVVPTTSQDSVVKSSSIVFTSGNSGVEKAPAYVDIQRQWKESDFGMGVQSLGIALEGLEGGSGKMVVFGNGDFYSNGSDQQPRQLPADHVNLISNSIDWLVDDTGLIALRTKGIDSRPLENIEDGTKEALKYANVFAPILLLLVYAFVRRLRNQRKRQKWMQGNFD